MLRLQLAGGQVTVAVAGSPGYLHTLWRALTLAPASWSAVTNRVTNSAGQTALIDASPPGPGAFYRVSVM